MLTPSCHTALTERNEITKTNTKVVEVIMVCRDLENMGHRQNDSNVREFKIILKFEISVSS